MIYRFQEHRSGNIVTLAALLLIPIVALIGLAIELGVISVGHAELQRAADSSAMAAAWELVEAKFSGETIDNDNLRDEAILAAKEYAIANSRPHQWTAVNDDEIEIGYLNQSDSGGLIAANQSGFMNAARVTLRRDQQTNGPIRLLFASIFGTDNASISASATAAVFFDVSGFRQPSSMLPFALDLDTWTSIEQGIGEDNWSWDHDTGQFYNASDGILEFNFYPQDTGSNANGGTLNIGGPSNSTSRISRQILEGLSAEDLDFHGGELALDESGELVLSGDPGISAGFQDEFQEIIGQDRVLAVYAQSSGEGGNHQQYTIVKWVGVKIIDVKLNGNNKYIIAQPAPVMVTGAIQSSNGDTSPNLFSPVWLVE